MSLFFHQEPILIYVFFENGIFADSLKIFCQHFIRTLVKKGPKKYVTSRIHCNIVKRKLCFTFIQGFLKQFFRGRCLLFTILDYYFFFNSKPKDVKSQFLMDFRLKVVFSKSDVRILTNKNMPNHLSS